MKRLLLLNAEKRRSGMLLGFSRGFQFIGIVEESKLQTRVPLMPLALTDLTRNGRTFDGV